LARTWIILTCFLLFSLSSKAEITPKRDALTFTFLGKSNTILCEKIK
jgi:hypothetical protein